MSVVLAFALLAAAPQVHTIGTLRSVIHEGRIEARAPIKSLTGRRTFALGALARLEGEFIVLDGKAFVSRPGDLESVVAAKDSVALAVHAKVRSWRVMRVTQPISLAAMGDTLASRAAQFGLPVAGPFPFLIEGGADSVQWHVADGSKLPSGPSSHEAHMAASVRGVRDTDAVTFLGFYSDHHQGVFTHHDSPVHVHAYFPEDGLVGHVDGGIIRPGATIKFPIP